MKISRQLGRTMLMAKKFSPEILLIFGTAGIISAFIWVISLGEKAYKLKLVKQEKLNMLINPDAKDELAEIDMAAVKEVKVDYFAGLCRVYVGPVLIGIISLGAIVGSFKILKSRNIALGLALAAVQEKFNEYRQRVKEKYGEEEELQIANNSREVSILTTDANGNTTEEKVMLKDGLSIHSRVFDASCSQYTKDAEANKLSILAAQHYFNKRLAAVGHVFLNEVYDEFDMPRTSNGAVYGWVFDPKRPEGHISFGLTDVDFDTEGLSRKADFINGYETCVWLDFNCDGVIYDLI